MEGNIACRHQKVSCIDGENTCTSCGTVFGAEHVNEGSDRNSNTRPNLFVAQSLGTRNGMPDMRGMESVKRYFRGGISDERKLSAFSNVCEKLALPQHIRVDAHQRFARINKQMEQKTAEHACVAIFRACRSHGIPRLEEDIVEAVRVAYRRKRMPTMTRMAVQHMHISDGGEKGDGGKKYYFGVALTKRLRDGDMPKQGYDRIVNLAWFFYTQIYTDGRYSCRAADAVDHAFGRGFRVRRKSNAAA